MIPFRTASFLACSLVLCLYCQILHSQTPDSTSARSRITRVPSITVTTTRAEKFTSPVVFSDISRAEIEKLATYQDLPALLAELPSVIFYSDNGNNVGYSTLSMRGFDQRRISVMINGVPQNDPEDHSVYWINFPDLTSNLGSVQVQRGAGLMNYGHAAIGGSVNLTTSNFAESASFLVSTGLGFQELGVEQTMRLNIQRYSVEASSGLVSVGDAKYALYTRLTDTRSEGYREQSWAQLRSFFVGLARFDDKLTTQVNIFGGPIADGLAYTGLPKAFVGDLRLRRTNFSAWGYDANRNLEYTVTRRPQEIENFSQPHYELLNDWYAAPNLMFKSTLFYYTGDGFFDYDGSWADAATLRLTPAFGFPAFPANAQPQNALIRAFVGNRHGGWLPRVVWQHEGGELTAGVELRLHRSVRYGQIRYAEGLPAGFNPDFKIYEYNGERDIFSAFVREQFRLSDALSLNLEAQIVRHSYRIRNERAGERFTTYTDANGTTVGNGGQLFDVNFLFVNPRVGVNYLLSENWSGFASVAYTSREPRMRNLYAAEDAYFGATPLFAVDTSRGAVRYDFSRPIVRPERMLDIELGSRFQTGVLAGAITAYWMEFTDELVRSGQRDIFGVPVDGNAPRTRHYGMEVELSSVLAEGVFGVLKASGHATLSRNVIVEYNLQQSDGTAVSLAGNPIAGFPDVMGAARLSFERENFFVSLAGRHVGAFYTDNLQDEFRKNDAYTVFSLDAAYTFKQVFGLKSLRLRAQVNNLFNTLYASGGVGNEFFPAAERNVFVAVELGL
jgi:iron complex outermembrane receptor protein